MAQDDGLARSRSSLDNDEFSVGAKRQFVVRSLTGLGNGIENLTLSPQLSFGEPVEWGGLEEGGVLDVFLGREERWIALVQRIPHPTENRIELVVRVVVALRVRPAIVEALDGADAEQVVHHAVLDVEREGLVEVLVADYVLLYRGGILVSALTELLPVFASEGVSVEVLGRAVLDVVRLANIGDEAFGLGVLVGGADVDGGEVRDEVGLFRVFGKDGRKLAVHELPNALLNDDRLGDSIHSVGLSVHAACLSLFTFP